MPERPGMSLEEWYPLVQPLALTPETVILRTDRDLAPMLYTDSPDAPDVSKDVERLVTAVRGVAERVGGFPLFLRTGLMSGKHGWQDTCYVPDAESVGQHIYNIVEESEMADMVGGRPTDVWVVRRLLNTRPVFTAFHGHMPITRERRYFFVDGEVVGHQPYWPGEVFEENEPSIETWREKLDDINHEWPPEVTYLTHMTKRVAEAIPGAWSVDWLFADPHWYLIDMAWAEVSYVWEDYPTAPKGAW